MFTNGSREETLEGWARVFLGELRTAPVDHNLFSEVLTKSLFNFSGQNLA